MSHPERTSEQTSGEFADNIHRNREVLTASELGPQLVEAYDIALSLWPEIADTVIVPLEEGEHPTILAAAIPSWSPNNTTGQHQVLFRTHNTEAAIAQSEAVLDAIPQSRELVAESFGITPDELTPQMDHVATFLHELGHAKEFKEFSPEAFIERKKPNEWQCRWDQCPHPAS